MSFQLHVISNISIVLKVIFYISKYSRYFLEHQFFLVTLYLLTKRQSFVDEKMLQHLGMLSPLIEGEGLLPVIHDEWLKTPSNSNSRDIQDLSVLHGHLHLPGAYTVHTHIH